MAVDKLAVGIAAGDVIVDLKIRGAYGALLLPLEIQFLSDLERTAVRTAPYGLRQRHGELAFDAERRALHGAGHIRLVGVTDSKFSREGDVGRHLSRGCYLSPHDFGDRVRDDTVVG